MIDPEISYLLWRLEQSRRGKKLERRREYLDAMEPQPLPDPARDHGDEPPGCELEEAS
jgi:hypothetical protein